MEVSSKQQPVTSSASRPISNYSSVAQEEVTTESVVRGNWRRDMAKYEDNPQQPRNRKLKSQAPTAPVTSSLTTSLERPTTTATTATTRTSHSPAQHQPESTTETFQPGAINSRNMEVIILGQPNQSISKPAEVPKSVSSSKPAVVVNAKPVTISKPVERLNPVLNSKQSETPSKPAPKPVENS